MNKIRLLLFPLAILYTLITSLRNILFDLKVFKSHEFETPLIGIGNLSSGGTGKTPMVEYIFKFFSNEFKLALLSRGFKRSTSGYIKANPFSDSNEIGDEPFQIFSKFNHIDVAVDENRVRGVKNLLKDSANLQSIVLDDCFQHRSVSLQLNILLTTYRSPFYTDFVLPCGDLRELKSGYKRADLVVITKCPNDLSKKLMEETRLELSLKSNQKLFFTSIKYNNYLHGESEIKISDINNLKVLLVTGVAHDNEIVNYLKSKKIQFDKISFSDHYNYSAKDIQKIELEYSDRIIITTEKDYQKIKLINRKNKWYYLQIEITFLDNEDSFKKIIRDTIIK